MSKKMGAKILGLGLILSLILNLNLFASDLTCFTLLEQKNTSKEDVINFQKITELSQYYIDIYRNSELRDTPNIPQSTEEILAFKEAIRKLHANQKADLEIQEWWKIASPKSKKKLLSLLEFKNFSSPLKVQEAMSFYYELSHQPISSWTYILDQNIEFKKQEYLAQKTFEYLQTESFYKMARHFKIPQAEGFKSSLYRFLHSHENKWSFIKEPLITALEIQYLPILWFSKFPNLNSIKNTIANMPDHDVDIWINSKLPLKDRPNYSSLLRSAKIDLIYQTSIRALSLILFAYLLYDIEEKLRLHFFIEESAYRQDLERRAYNFNLSAYEKRNWKLTEDQKKDIMAQIQKMPTNELIKQLRFTQTNLDEL